ncbi:hypothetical protein LOK74_14280 [Brevibacillus humidisoli]|uniref:hypothetical protein n=1 Tax=Brevibacillus humidisoli TaxID=2895522 RepID=UPI001E51B4B9|nr:hypothetical protein [Brevibacillus humidisoli]UFJ39237.1 hypothetical protein LOK74_14280 [Brevibacillus humidisoli]
MSKQERNWQRFWKFMMIYFYVLITPAGIILSFYRWEFPLDLLILAIGIPYMRSNHLKQIRKKNSEPVG